ncbi:MAG: hypothetical protein KAU29_03760 [Gammaproteobacteria bacterium]|nr:hypothetical protein [Gammaproteobacteria bacterium]
MYKIICKSAFVLTAFILCNPALSAENNSDSVPTFGWATLGYGFFLADEADALGQGYMLGLSVQRGPHVLILRGNGFEDENVVTAIFGGSDCSEPNLSATLECTNEVREFKNYGILYGRRTRNIIYAIGLEEVHVDSRLTFTDTVSRGTVNIKRELISEVGIAIETQFHVLPRRFAGLSIVVAANINKESSYIGATVNLRLGYVK